MSGPQGHGAPALPDGEGLPQARRADCARGRGADGLPGASGLTVLVRRSDFLAANRGLRIVRPGFVLLARPNGAAGMRYGITVTRKIGKAVVRNRMRRRLRALLRELLPVAGLANHDHVLIGREGGVERDFARLRAELGEALARAAAGKGDRPRPSRRPGKPAGAK